MAGDFFERIDELREKVGHGTLSGKVEVDQVYAHYQHEDLTLNHPRGGQGKYLEGPLLAGSEDWMRTVAKQVLEEGPADGMKEVVERVSDKVELHAPVEFDHLRRSGHPTVTDDGTVVYDRAPKVGRLSEEELKAERRGIHTPTDHPRHNRGHHG